MGELGKRLDKVSDDPDNIMCELAKIAILHKYSDSDDTGEANSEEKWSEDLVFYTKSEITTEDSEKDSKSHNRFRRKTKIRKNVKVDHQDETSSNELSDGGYKVR